RERQEEASKADLAEMYDEVQAQIDVDHEFAVRLTHEEQEKYTVEESMTLKELTDLCTTLLQKVLDLENVKTAQAMDIASLKKRLTKLEQRQSSRFLGFHPFRVDEDADTKMIIEDKGNGEKGGSIAEIVSTARPDISAARQEVNTVESKSPPTTTTLFDDEDVTIANNVVEQEKVWVKIQGDFLNLHLLSLLVVPT
nr:hypothetical protein [Tanacetum cinerariifolium]